MKIAVIAIFCIFLTACNVPQKPVENDPNQLPAGIMEPVLGSGASERSYSWPSDIQSTSMPATMK